MTVCIAALCEKRRTIVALTDQKISFGGDYSVEDAVFKNDPIHANWVALYAGNDILEVDFILERAASQLKSLVSIPTRLEVADIVHDAYVERLRRHIEAQVLSRYGFSYETFLKDGKTALTEHVYNQLSASIANVNLSLQFIVAGFDAKGYGHLMYIDGQSPPASYDKVGFCAIGTGASAALSSLAFHADKIDFSVYSAWPRCVYCCCEAKFMAESASDVGKSTFLTILKRDEPARFMQPPQMDRIRKAWEDYGASRVPKTIVEEMPGMVISFDSAAPTDSKEPESQQSPTHDQSGQRPSQE